MQGGNQGLSITRRPLDVEDYIDIVRRHKAWILGPAFAGLVIAVVVAFLWPDTYVSYASLRVEPQKVPEKFVQSNVNVEMAARIQSMAERIRSRPVLINIIQSYDLYPRERKSMPIEDVVEEMRKNIGIGQVTSQFRGSTRLSAFQISFTYENRYIAQKVCSEIVSRFIDENIRERANQSVATTDFLREQYDAARKELEEIEAKIVQFRAANAGRLPEQLQANLQQLSALENRINVLQNSISRAGQDKLVLETQLRSLKEQAKFLAEPPPPVTQASTVSALSQKIQQLDREIERAELSLSGIRERYTAAHPDVQRSEQALAWLRRQREALARQEELSREAALKEIESRAQGGAAPAPRLLTPAQKKELQDLQGRIEQIELAIRAKDLESERADKEIKDSERQLKVLQARIEASPLNEPEYQQLLREREAAKERYTDMQRKKSQSETATLIEDRRQGENLELLDPPTLPQTPTYPKRWLIIGVGSVLGLIGGLFLAGAREVKDTSLKNLKDVRTYAQFSILGSIPLLENDVLVRRRRRIMWLAWTTAVLFGMAIMGASVYYYYTVTKT